jgi:hypothetical protein
MAAQLADDQIPELGISGQPPRLGPPAALVGLVVRVVM